MSMFDRLPEDTQTLHAELLALLVAIEGERRFAAKRWPEAQDGGEVVRRGLSNS